MTCSAKIGKGLRISNLYLGYFSLDIKAQLNPTEESVSSSEDSSDDGYSSLRPEYRPRRPVVHLRDEHESSSNEDSSDGEYPSLRPEYRPNRPL
ncbi:hypothetical protein AVEN_244642-1, partial [Araneus ventricosus]